MPVFEKVYNFDNINDTANNDWTFTNPDGTTGLTSTEGGTARQWNLDSNITKSSNVGPLAPQTGVSYLYTEASSPTTTNDDFIMTSGLIDASDNNISLDFWYSADTDGDAVQLTVSVWNGVKWTREYDQNVGSAAADWINIILDLNQYNNIDMQIEIKVGMGATGTTWHKDLGLDNIRIIGSSFSTDDVINYFKNSNILKHKLGDSFNLSTMTEFEAQTLIDSFQVDSTALNLSNYPHGIIIKKNDTISVLIKG